MEETKQLLRSLRAVVRFLSVIVLLVFVAIGILEFQLQRRNHDISKLHGTIDNLSVAAEDTRVAANAAKTASEKSSDDLARAIAAYSKRQPNSRLPVVFDEIHQTYVIVKQRFGTGG